MPISEEQRVLLNRLKEHLAGPMSDDLRREVSQTIRMYDSIEDGLTWIDKATGTIVGSITKLAEKFKGENPKE